MTTDRLLRQALKIGRANADDVISCRTNALRQRAQAIGRRVTYAS